MPLLMNYLDHYMGEVGGVETFPAPYDDDMEINHIVGQRSVPFDPAPVEEVPHPSPNGSAQQPLESTGDVKSTGRTSRKNRRRRQKRRDRVLSGKEEKRRERHAEAVKNAMTVPVELVNLRPSLKTRHGSRVYRHEELARLGVRTIQWDGVGSIPIKTPSGIVIALLAGRPYAPSWSEQMKSLAGDLNTTANSMTLETGGNRHHCGDYPAINIGVSYGGGSQSPGELTVNGVRTMSAIAELKDNRSLWRLVRYVDSVCSSHAPDLHTFCKARLTELEQWNLGLRRPFKDTAFSAMTFNFGPGPAIPHKDFKNLSFGWCSITSLGEFDATRGGHLVLWDLDIAIEFPSHSTILIPSAILEHSNTAIQDGENRMSITQYNPAGIFEWIAHGFQPKHVAVSVGKEPADWWSKPQHMFSTIV